MLKWNYSCPVCLCFTIWGEVRVIMMPMMSFSALQYLFINFCLDIVCLMIYLLSFFQIEMDVS
uniref:Uncharacterized protein n=1 Tax=Esox lucius TaxID=8010 RepID=A0A3P8ZGP7_ESOLU